MWPLGYSVDAPSLGPLGAVANLQVLRVGGEQQASFHSGGVDGVGTSGQVLAGALSITGPTALAGPATVAGHNVDPATFSVGWCDCFDQVGGMQGNMLELLCKQGYYVTNVKLGSNRDYTWLTQCGNTGSCDFVTCCRPCLNYS